MSFTYRGLKATLERHIVTETEIDQQLEQLRRQNPQTVHVDDRRTQNGDEVVLDYAGFCDGVQFPGGTAENQTLVLGSGMFIPGFEEQLLDKAIGEDVVVKVTFPTEYHAPDLAGKDAEFKCTIKEIRLKTQYELDDTFAKEIGQCENLEEMREKMRASMQAYADERGEMDLQDRLLRQAADTLDYTVDPAELEAAVSEQMKSLEAQLAHQGLTLEMYCQFMNTTVEDLRKDAYPAAEAALRNQAAIERIVELENLDVTKEEIGHAVALIARQNRITVEELKEHYSADLESAVIRSVLTTKAMELIRAHAELVEE